MVHVGSDLHTICEEILTASYLLIPLRPKWDIRRQRPASIGTGLLPQVVPLPMSSPSSLARPSQSPGGVRLRAVSGIPPWSILRTYQANGNGGVWSQVPHFDSLFSCRVCHSGKGSAGFPKPYLDVPPCCVVLCDEGTQVGEFLNKVKWYTICRKRCIWSGVDAHYLSLTGVSV